VIFSRLGTINSGGIVLLLTANTAVSIFLNKSFSSFGFLGGGVPSDKKVLSSTGVALYLLYSSSVP